MGRCFAGDWQVEGSCPGSTAVLRVVVAGGAGDATFKAFFRMGVGEAAGTSSALVHVLRVFQSGDPAGLEVWFDVLMQDDPDRTFARLRDAFADHTSALYARLMALTPLTLLGDPAPLAEPPTEEILPREARVEKETPVWVWIVLGIAGFCCCWAGVVLVGSMMAPTKADHEARKNAECRRKAEEAKGMHMRTTLV
eukprot:Hpha_TRINITY_DN12802_c0_g1::TRINITY_DN12802_c0_g1_i2::g.24147::m.24147